MVLNFTLTLQQALSEIKFSGESREFPVHQGVKQREGNLFEGLIQRYGEAKWKIVDLLNQHYSQLLENPFDLHNWLNHNQDDEVAYFLNEAGSNCLNHSEYKAPYKFQVWLGHKGFIIGIEQKGTGFDAHKVHQQKLKTNEGAAFEFFRRSRSQIFFDDPHDARTVFMEYKFG